MNLEQLFEEVLREMGRVTVSVGCEIIAPLFNKNITNNPQEIQDAIEKIYSYGRRGTLIFCNDNHERMRKDAWLDAVIERIINMIDKQLEKDNTLIKELFLAKRTQR